MSKDLLDVPGGRGTFFRHASLSPGAVDWARFQRLSGLENSKGPSAREFLKERVEVYAESSGYADSEDD